MRFIQVLFMFILFAVVVNAGCASWALRKMSDDYLECYRQAGSDSKKVRACLREWKYSLEKTDCTDDKFKALYQQFCEGHNAGSFVCDL